MKSEVKIALYRHFDKAGQLLYVGISLSTINRWLEHKRNSKWGGDVTRIDIEWYESRADALDAERMAIQQESPRFNIRYSAINSKNIAQLTMARLSEYILKIGDTQAAKLFGVSERTAKSWRLGERSPRLEQQKTIVSKSPVTYEGIALSEKMVL